MPRARKAGPGAAPPLRSRVGMRFLSLYTRFGAAFRSQQDFCKAYKISWRTIKNLEDRNQPFREAVAAARSQHRVAGDVVSIEDAKLRHPELEEWKAVFLEDWR